MSADITIKYERGSWKYRLTESYPCILKAVNLPGDKAVDSDWYTIAGSALLADVGYAWDGPTFAPDYEQAMRASLVHDVLYQAIKRGEIPKTMRPAADKEFRLIMKEDGAPWLRRWGWYFMVRLFGGAFAAGKSK